MARLFLFSNKKNAGQIQEEQNEKRNTAEMRRTRRSRSSNNQSNYVQDNSQDGILPTAERGPHHHHPDRTPHRINTGIQPAGESGRRGIHPIKFIKIVWDSASRASKLCGFLWPVVPAAITIGYVRPDLHLWIFILNYIAMVPCANLIGFAGQELARKMHKVLGVLIETTLGSIVEIVLFMVLLKNNEFEVIKAAILGSILATQLLCLGLCFVVGGARHDNQEFDEVVGEVGSDLLLTA
jgi:Ca2+:H+ antiporter